MLKNTQYTETLNNPKLAYLLNNTSEWHFRIGKQISIEKVKNLTKQFLKNKTFF